MIRKNHGVLRRPAANHLGKINLAWPFALNLPPIINERRCTGESHILPLGCKIVRGVGLQRRHVNEVKLISKSSAGSYEMLGSAMHRSHRLARRTKSTVCVDSCRLIEGTSMVDASSVKIGFEVTRSMRIPF